MYPSLSSFYCVFLVSARSSYVGSCSVHVIDFKSARSRSRKHPLVAHVATVPPVRSPNLMLNVCLLFQDVVVQPELSSEFPLVCQSAQSSTVLTTPVRTFKEFLTDFDRLKRHDRSWASSQRKDLSGQKCGNSKNVLFWSLARKLSFVIRITHNSNSSSY